MLPRGRCRLRGGRLPPGILRRKVRIISFRLHLIWHGLRLPHLLGQPVRLTVRRNGGVPLRLASLLVVIEETVVTVYRDPRRRDVRRIGLAVRGWRHVAGERRQASAAAAATLPAA